MNRVGVVTQTDIETNGNGEARRVMLQVKITAPEDVQKVEYLNPVGEDSRPVVGSLVMVVKVSNNWKFAIPITDGLEPSAEEGERHLYSSNGTTKLVSVKLKSNSKVAIANDAESLHQLNADLIDIIKSITISGSSVSLASQAALDGVKIRYNTLLDSI